MNRESFIYHAIVVSVYMILLGGNNDKVENNGGGKETMTAELLKSSSVFHFVHNLFYCQNKSSQLIS